MFYRVCRQWKAQLTLLLKVEYFVWLGKYHSRWFPRPWSHQSITRHGIGFRSGFSQCVNYMRFNEKQFCFRWQEDTRTHANPNTKTSNLALRYDLRYLMGNISSMMTKHIVVQRRLYRFAYLIIRIILCYQLWFTHAIPPLYFSSMSAAPELNTGNIALTETTSEAYCLMCLSRIRQHILFFQSEFHLLVANQIQKIAVRRDY